LAPLAIFFAISHQPHLIYAPLLLLGMLSDVFDGVIARRLGVARPWLRRFDSATDIIFYLCIFVTTYFVAGDVVRKAIIPLSLLAASELACVAVGLVRFGSLPAIHSYSAKIYGLTIFLAFLGVLAFDFGSWAFFVLAIIALIANAEIIAILLLSRNAPVDVLSVFHINRKAA
jgi:CDP-diacylglycerol--glycerol-3-phosphate 3-phosphatidyltransferase